MGLFRGAKPARQAHLPGLLALGARAAPAERETSPRRPFPPQVLTNAPAPGDAAEADEARASAAESARTAEDLHRDRLLDILSSLGADLQVLVGLEIGVGPSLFESMSPSSSFFFFIRGTDVATLCMMGT